MFFECGYDSETSVSLVVVAVRWEISWYCSLCSYLRRGELFIDTLSLVGWGYLPVMDRALCSVGV